MITRYDHFYDAQMRRFLEQIVRAFSGFQYLSGRRGDEPAQLRLVPCRIASMDRMVAQIQRNLSENTLLTVPLITVAQTGLTGRREDLQHPGHVDTRQVVEREFAEDGYTSARGVSYTVERLMPRPFTMNVQVDIWTSNMDQKHQLAEQILTVIYPAFDIQNSDNALDWSALTTIYVEDINWSSRSIPVGTESEIEVMTINLRLPFWLSPPARVSRQRLIEQITANLSVEQIVTNLGDLTPGPDRPAGGVYTQSVITPGNHHIRVENDRLTLLWGNGDAERGEGERPSWATLLQQYGVFRPGETRIHLRTAIEGGPEIVGTVDADPTRPERLFWTVDPDTLPSNTLSPVRAIIDPLRTSPETGLPTPVNGHRYLLIESIGPSQAWGNLTARAGDIIQYGPLGWTVAFDAASATPPHYVLNLHTGRQLRWSGQDWEMAIEGVYAPGFWRLYL